MNLILRETARMHRGRREGPSAPATLGVAGLPQVTGAPHPDPMSEASIDEVLSEEDFQPLAKERGERFGRLAHTLLARAPGGWTRRHFYQLIVEADVFEAFLDDHGAAYNRTYRLFRELVASVRGLARAGYAVRHLESRFDSYGTRLSAIPIEEERFCEAVEEARRFLEESLRGLLAESLEEAARRGVDLSSASFSEARSTTVRANSVESSGSLLYACF